MFLLKLKKYIYTMHSSYQCGLIHHTLYLPTYFIDLFHCTVPHSKIHNCNLLLSQLPLNCHSEIIWWLHLIIILSFSKVPSLREHLSGLKTLPCYADKAFYRSKWCTIGWKNSYLAIPQEDVLLCNNLCPVCSPTGIQVAIKKVISTFSHGLAIFNNKRFNTFE